MGATVLLVALLLLLVEADVAADAGHAVLVHEEQHVHAGDGLGGQPRRPPSNPHSGGAASRRSAHLRRQLRRACRFQGPLELAAPALLLASLLCEVASFGGTQVSRSGHRWSSCGCYGRCEG